MPHDNRDHGTSLTLPNWVCTCLPISHPSHSAVPSSPAHSMLSGANGSAFSGALPSQSALSRKLDALQLAQATLIKASADMVCQLAS